MLVGQSSTSLIILNVFSSQKIIVALLSCHDNNQALLIRFQEFLEYDDVRYFAMKITLKVLKETEITVSV